MENTCTCTDLFIGGFPALVSARPDLYMLHSSLAGRKCLKQLCSTKVHRLGDGWKRVLPQNSVFGGLLGRTGQSRWGRFAFRAHRAAADPQARLLLPPVRAAEHVFADGGRTRGRLRGV